MKEINGYSGYFINEFGEVYSNNKYLELHKLKPQINHKGYIRYNLCKNGKNKLVMAHRLVAEHFLLDFNKELQVNHKDGNKLNNHHTNLECVNCSENLKHAYSLNLINKQGERHNQSKLKNEDIINIRKLGKEGKSKVEIAKLFSLHPSTVSNIINRRIWKHI